MHNLLSILFIVICLFCYITNKHKILAFIFILTLFNGDFQFNIGVSFNVYHFITLLYVPKIIIYLSHNQFLKKILKPLIIELFIIFIFGLIYGFIFPFDDPFESYRSFTQRANMRSIISFSRLLIEFFSILLVVYWIDSKKIKIDLLIKYFAIVIIISFVIAILVYFMPRVFRILFPNFTLHFYGVRFTGLVGEPRTMGRFFGFSLIFLLFYKNVSFKKTRIVAIIISLIAVLLSLSASTLIVTGIGLFIYLLVNRKLSSLTLLTLMITTGFLIFNNNEFFQETTMYKIKSVLAIEQKEKPIKLPNEPDLFTRFEIFDRAALNFLYNNPKYALLGVGPNLISIPASRYLPPEYLNSEVYGYGINTVPTTFLVNTISRSGIVGLFLYLFFFFTIYDNLSEKKEKYCFFVISIMQLLTSSNLFLLITGISIAIIITNRKKSFQKTK